MTTDPTSAPQPTRSYFILGMNHDMPSGPTMEVHFTEDGHTYRLNLWRPADPSQIDAAIKAAWPVNEFAAMKAAATRKPEFDALIGQVTSVAELPVQTAHTPAAGLVVQRPAR